MDRNDPPEDPTGHDEPTSPYAPPPRRAGLSRNTNMVVVIAVVAVAVVVAIVLLAVN